jgi:AbiV family abortive infection protein
MAAAYEAARALVTDAQLLLEHDRWPRAAALAILAIEEGGKASIIRMLLVARSDEERRDEWRNYRTHTRKNVLAGLPHLVRSGARSLDDLAGLYDPENERPHALDVIKQTAFYSEATGEPCKWLTPETVISESYARAIVALAKVLTDRDEPMSSEAELEIWLRHLKPVWKGPAYEMKQALAACYTEAEASGVLRGKHTASEMVRFLFGATV